MKEGEKRTNYSNAKIDYGIHNNLRKKSWKGAQILRKGKKEVMRNEKEIQKFEKLLSRSTVLVVL